MGVPDFMRLVIATLEELEIPYAVTGSWATMQYGEPRSTQDTDILIDPTLDQLRSFVAKFQDTAMAELDAALDAFRNSEMFNIIDYETLDKVDLIHLKKTAYERKKFSRRNRIVFMGLPMYFVTAEDSILSKLEWMKESESERQLRDVVGTMLSQWETLDWDYLRHWVERLGIETVFEKALQSANQRR